MLENFTNKQTDEFVVVKDKNRTMFYGLTLTFFSIAVLLMFGLSFATLYILRSQFFVELFLSNKGLYLTIGWAVLLIATIFIIWFLNRMKLVGLIISFPIVLITLSSGIGILLNQYQYLNPNTDVVKLLGIMLIPAAIMLVAGILGTFNLVDMRAISIVSILLFVAFIIAFIVSFFVDRANWWIAVIGVALLSITSIINWYIIRKEADLATYNTPKEVVTKALYFGINTFILYAQLLWYILEMFIGTSRE
ncbi:hypothetical protein GE118_03815 [Mycoplasma sp. NEAQ87857]|uniref:MAG0110 family membrane protein n=1 Tax=Mycoplasma sp. NEAQ87857 TaxID=2683967 RepID=UPI0013160679|nr:hypothetical protein [Mycoplasma sp. NEAQ87857]QGZ97909.1 hypothetical protein GE118_03815 [Mycoplasma sp. NEAQ87857]